MEAEAYERYSRQIRFRQIGESGQRKIRAASVTIIGCGALGSFQAEALARAGIGRLRLVDRDYVELSNLQRQFLYSESDAANELPKAIAAANRIEQINRDIAVETAVADFTPCNAEELVEGSDLILDGTDNFETRYLINDVGVKTGTPWIYGAAIGATGIVMPVVPNSGPCFACIYPEPPSGSQPTCDVDGVLSSTTATVAALQVAQALRLIVGAGDVPHQIQTLDVWQGQARQIPTGPKDPLCHVCGAREFRYLERQRRTPVSLCGKNAVQLHEQLRPVDLRVLAARLRGVGDVRVNDFALRLAISKYELTFFPDGRAIVKGTTDVGVARSIYAQIIGG